MNSTIRLVVSCAAAAAIAAAAGTTARAQTGRRGTGNTAEVERLERERREREMRERDLHERQFLLRNMEADRRPAERPRPRLDVPRIREDFVRLQVVNNDLARAVSKGGALDLKLVSKSAAEIKKLAARLRENLALPEKAEGSDSPEAKAQPAPEQLSPALSALDALILKFADDLASRGVSVVDPESSVLARRTLEEIITLSGWVKKTSEKLEKSSRQPR